MAVGLVVMYRNRLQRPPGTSLGDVAGIDDRSFQTAGVVLSIMPSIHYPRYIFHAL